MTATTTIPAAQGGPAYAGGGTTMQIGAAPLRGVFKTWFAGQVMGMQVGAPTAEVFKACPGGQVMDVQVGTPVGEMDTKPACGPQEIVCTLLVQV